MIKLYNDDCLKIMTIIPDKSVDMILCDLPYGVTSNETDNVIPFEPLWKHYNRIIKDNGCICLFAQGLFFVDLVNSQRDLFKYDLVWDKLLKTGFLDANYKPLRQHEQIAVFYKNLPTYNPQMIRGQRNHAKGTAHKFKTMTNNNYGNFVSIESDTETDLKYPTSILKFQKPHPSVAKHRTEKPIELLEYLIKTYTNENDIVLDNCMGAGSCGIASKKLNRSFIGIEINKEYFNIAKERIELIKVKRGLL